VFTRLLVGLDGSTGAEAALDAALTLAQPERATIVLAAVTDIRLLEAPLLESAGPLWTEGVPVAPVASDLRAALDERARTFLADGVERVTAAGLTVETVRAVGLVDEELLRLAEDADALVMGRRGDVHTMPGKIGAVTAHVIKRAPLPVIVAGDRTSTFETPAVAFDGGETSAAALLTACRFAAHRRLSLDVVHVTEDPAAGAAILEKARALAAAQGVTVRTHALEGDIVEAVAAWVVRSGTDLLVAGAHGGRGTPWPIGSHAEKLIRATVVPVMIHR
jgi:nucleotide-binding universal stress UspA family protein